MVGRLPESWIPPEHILDLRARVTVATLAGRAARRMAAAHSRRCSITTDCRSQRKLMTDGGRQWPAAQTLPATAREQSMVAIALIDALDRQLAPIDKQLRSCAATRAASRAAGR
jgi:transposase